MRLALWAALLVAAASPARAQEAAPPTGEPHGEPAPEPAPVPPAPPALTAPAISWEALVDTYYQHHFTGPSSRQAADLRAFDRASNSFTLAYAELAAHVAPEPVGLRIDVGYGHTGTVVNGAAAASSGGADDMAAKSLYGSALLLQQAFATVRLGRVTVDAGKFVRAASAEAIEARSNWTYSRSLLFAATPWVHTGVRIGVRLGAAATVQASLVNGFNNDPDGNAAKTVALTGTLVPTVRTTLAGTLYAGKETLDGGGDVSTLLDLVATHLFTDRVGMTVNADWARTDGTWWLGAAATGRAIATEHLRLALRGEYVRGDDGGYAGLGDVDLFAATLTVGVAVARNFELRVEGRGDFSNDSVFPDGMNARAQQVTALASALAWLP